MSKERIDVERLLDAVDLVALAELAGAQFKRSGKAVRSACPLHGGDNPTAFTVSSEGERQVWRCWTQCNAGGDAITFVRKWKGLDFIEAVRWLAEYARIPVETLGLTAENTRARQEREQRADLLDLAAQYYRAQFAENARVQAYVKGRGFREETIQTAGFGYSNGTGLHAWLAARDADIELARTLGLLRKDGLDFTANANGQAASPTGWLIYTHRERERVVAFSARALDPVDAKDKSRNLPGERQLYRAEVQGERGLVLVEGQADAESLQQAGYSAWALCGTEIGERDVHALARRRPVYLALDGDKAGRTRTAVIAPALGPLVMIAPEVPGGHKDVNAWLMADAEFAASVRTWLTDSRPWIDVALARAQQCAAYELEEWVAQIAALIDALPEKLHGRYLRAASKALDMPARDLRTHGGNGLHTTASHTWAEEREGRLYYRGDLLGHFSARITHELVEDDGQNLPSIRYTVAGQLPEGEALDTLAVAAEEFDGMKWLASWGARVMLDVPPSRAWMVSRAIKGLSVESMKRERVHTYSGWAQVGQKRVYLTGGGALTPDGLDPSVRVELGSSNLRYYRLPAVPTDVRTALQASLAFLDIAPLRVTVPLWAAMYAAPLTSLVPLNALLWVYGSTQSRKSTLTHLALTHFGPLFVKGREFRAPRDWMSTLTDLEGAMFATKDLPLVIDDYRPQASSAVAHGMKAKVDSIIRCIGNRSARGRANADLSERQQRPPRCLLIATSELPLSDQSTVGRTIVVPVDKSDVAITTHGEGALDRAQKLAGDGGPGLYAQAMSAYVQWLAGNWERAKEALTADLEEANQYARSVFPSSQSRLMDYYAVLVAGARMALRCADQLQAVERRTCVRLAQETVPQTLAALLLSQSKLVANQSPVARLAQALEDLLAQEKVYLAPRLSNAAITPPMGAALVGWYGREEGGMRCVYLLPEVCVQVTREYWAKAGENFDMVADAVNREMHQAGLIVRKDETRYISKVRIREAGVKWALIVDVDKFTQVTGIQLWPEGDIS